VSEATTPNGHEERLAELIDWLSGPENPSVRYKVSMFVISRSM